MNVLTKKIASYEKGFLRATVVQVVGMNRFIINHYMHGKKQTMTGLSDDRDSALSTAKAFVGV